MSELDDLLAGLPPQRQKYLRALAAQIGEEEVAASLRPEPPDESSPIVPPASASPAEPASPRTEFLTLDASPLLACLAPDSQPDSSQPDSLLRHFQAKSDEARARARAVRPRQRMDRYEHLTLYERASILPNLAAKAMLFAPVKPGRRKFVREYTPVPVWGLEDVEVSYKHEQLNQLDLNVFLMLVNFAKRRGDPYRAAFTRREALRFLGLNDSGKSYINLDGIIDRLGSTRVQVAVVGTDEQGQHRRCVLRDALAPRDYQESVSGKYVVELSKTLSGFMAVDDWSLVSIEQRLELGQNQWALAIHAFLSSSRPPAWFTWEQIHSLWGQGYAELKKLKYDFKKRVLKPLHDIKFLKKVEEKETAIGMWW